MSASNMKETYLLKKVKTYWLIGAEGRRFKRCPVLTNAKEVEISDNYLIADDDIYEIQGNEAGEVTLVKIDDLLVHRRQQNNKKVANNANSSEQNATVDSKEENNLSDKSETQEIEGKENTQNNNSSSKAQIQIEPKRRNINHQTVSSETVKSFPLKIFYEHQTADDRRKDKNIDDSITSDCFKVSLPNTVKSEIKTNVGTSGDHSKAEGNVKALEGVGAREEHNRVFSSKSVPAEYYTEDPQLTIKADAQSESKIRISDNAVLDMSPEKKSGEKEDVEISKKDELEIRQTEDDYQLLEAGHTEETSLIETISLTETTKGEAETDVNVFDNKQEKIKLSNIMLWEVITTRHSNELGQLKANVLDFKYDNGTIFVSIAGDSAIWKQRLKELRNFIEKFNNKECVEVPIETGEDNAAIWCDEIESKFGECCMYVPETRNILVYCDSYERSCKVKYFLAVKMGKVKSTRGHRRKCSSTNESIQSNISSQQTANKVKDMCPQSETTVSEIDNQPDEQTQKVDNNKYYVSGFETKENLKVYIYESSILNLKVDCIVSASNSRLAHGGGIAAIIARAAGVDLTRQGNEYIKKYGPIPTGKVCTTTAGKLPYTCVIHAIGPAWCNYSPHTEDLIKRCETDLYNAVYNSLLEAERRGGKSVGLPALSSGIFGVPEELCAHQYVKAVIDYSRNSVGRSNTLSEIHFIDTNTRMLQLVGEVSRSTLMSGCITEYDSIPKYHTGKFVVKSDFKSGFVETLETEMNLKPATLINPSNEKEKIFSWTTDAKNMEMYTTLEDLHVCVYQADILKLPVDCIVNASNDRLQHGGGVAAVIVKAAGRKLVEECDEFVRRNGKVPVGETCVTTAGLLPYQCVIHAPGPRWSDHYPHGIVDVTRCERHLYNVLCDCFLQAEKRKLRSIGLPAISSAISGVPEMLCIYQYVKATTNYSKRATKGGHVLSEIHFVDKNPAIVKKIQEAFHMTLVDKKQYPYDSRMFATDKSKGYQKYKFNQV